MGKFKVGTGTKVLLLLGGAVVLYHYSPKVRMLVGKYTGGIFNRTAGGGPPMTKANLGQGGLSSLTPLYFSGAAITGSNTSNLGPGGAGRSTLPGVINTSGFKGKYLNKYGR
jgi:hypothetical protein